MCSVKDFFKEVQDGVWEWAYEQSGGSEQRGRQSHEVRGGRRQQAGWASPPNPPLRCHPGPLLVRAPQGVESEMEKLDIGAKPRSSFKGAASKVVVGQRVAGEGRFFGSTMDLLT